MATKKLSKHVFASRFTKKYLEKLLDQMLQEKSEYAKTEDGCRYHLKSKYTKQQVIDAFSKPTFDVHYDRKAESFGCIDKKPVGFVCRVKVKNFPYFCIYDESRDFIKGRSVYMTSNPEPKHVDIWIKNILSGFLTDCTAIPIKVW